LSTTGGTRSRASCGRSRRRPTKESSGVRVGVGVGVGVGQAVDQGTAVVERLVGMRQRSPAVPRQQLDVAHRGGVAHQLGRDPPVPGLRAIGDRCVHLVLSSMRTAADADVGLPLSGVR
jgi:hypothetical protein